MNKKSDRGLISLHFFSGFFVIRMYIFTYVPVGKVFANGVVFLTFGAIAFGAI